jgi:hypothetical protein
MPALPKITNPLHPRISRSWITPIRFRTKPYLRLSESFSAALKQLEMKYPSHRKTEFEILETQRMTQRLRRKPK